MESNISFDHVQLVILQELMKKKIAVSRTIWNRIGSTLGICKPCVRTYVDFGEIVSLSFATAEAIMGMRRIHADMQQEFDKIINTPHAKIKEE